MLVIEGVPEVINEKAFYSNAVTYWNSVKPDTNGMLGGLPQLAPLDIQESKPFLKKLVQKYEMKTGRAVDLGAGIGRVTGSLLLPIFNQVFTKHLFI